ncbi:MULTISPECIES: AlpA family phage regulatory protein [Vibrio]|nr:hypothetical protein B9J87_02465 [Vibrio sp. V19_P1S1T109]
MAFPIRILRLKDVMDKTTLCRAAICRKMNDDNFLNQ